MDKKKGFEGREEENRLRRYWVFLMYLEEILNLLVKKKIRLGLKMIKEIGQSKVTFEFFPNILFYLPKNTIFEICMKNLVTAMKHKVLRTKYQIFNEILMKSKRNKFKNILCMVFQRKFTLLQTAFFLFKQFTLKKHYKRIITFSGQKRAFGTRIYHLILKQSIFAFNRIKAFNRHDCIIPIRVEYGLFDLSNLIADKFKEKQVFSMRKIRFEAKILKLLASGKITHKFQVIIKKLNEFYRDAIQEKLRIWVNYSCDVLFESQLKTNN